MFTLISLSFIGLGITFLGGYFLRFKVPNGYIAIKERGKSMNPKILDEGWHFGVKPPVENLIAIERKTIEIPPSSNEFIELHTPDDGILGVAVTVSYEPDANNEQTIKHYKVNKDIAKALENRVRSALNSWIRQKPLPGTLKRALVMKEEAENFIKAKITNIPSDTLAIMSDPSLYGHGTYSIYELGVRIHEVHIVDVQEVGKGTGKPNWGDDDLSLRGEKSAKELEGIGDNLTLLLKKRDEVIAKNPEHAEELARIYEDKIRKILEYEDQ
jgi:hypothetical protein